MKKNKIFQYCQKLKISEHVKIQKNFEHCQNFQFWSYQKLKFLKFKNLRIC